MGKKRKLEPKSAAGFTPVKASPTTRSATAKAAGLSEVLAPVEATMEKLPQGAGGEDV